MSQTDKIKLEKITFLENNSEKFYNELFNKDEKNNSTIILITNLLLKDEKLEECEEYNYLNKMIDNNEVTENNNSFLCNILGTITQFLTRIGSEDSAKVILSYSMYNNKEEFGKVKTLYMA